MVGYTIEISIKRDEVRALQVRNASEDQVSASKLGEAVHSYNFTASMDQFLVDRVDDGAVVNNVELAQNLLSLAVHS